MKVNTRTTAWDIVNNVFPTEYTKFKYESERAGYDVYRSTVTECRAWIHDFGKSIKIYFPDNSTLEIFINE